MKTPNLLLVLILFMSACSTNIEPTCTDGIQNQGELDTDCGGPCNACIPEFPDEGFYGTNMLNDTSVYFKNSESYSFYAEQITNSQLRVEIEPFELDSVQWFVLSSATSGWEGSTQSNSNLRFETDRVGSSDLEFTFRNSGKARLHFFIDGSPSSFKTKDINFGP